VEETNSTHQCGLGQIPFHHFAWAWDECGLVTV